MKTRNSLVSNSSTSSFICELCGEVEADRDLCITDAGMVTCKKGHTFHYPDVCIGGLKEQLNIPENITEDDDYDPYAMPEKYCPICRMLFVPSEATLKYLVDEKFHLDINQIHNEMRELKKDEIAKLIGEQ